MNTSFMESRGWNGGHDSATHDRSTAGRGVDRRRRRPVTNAACTHRSIAAFIGRFTRLHRPFTRRLHLADALAQCRVDQRGTHGTARTRSAPPSSEAGPSAGRVDAFASHRVAGRRGARVHRRLDLRRLPRPRCRCRAGDGRQGRHRPPVLAAGRDRQRAPGARDVQRRDGRLRRREARRPVRPRVQRRGERRRQRPLGQRPFVGVRLHERRRRPGRAARSSRRRTSSRATAAPSAASRRTRSRPAARRSSATSRRPARAAPASTRNRCSCWC